MQRGVEIAHTHGDLHGLASGLVSLSRLYTIKKQYTEAKEAGQRAKQLAQQEAYPELHFLALFYLRVAASADNKSSLVRVYTERMRSIRRKLEAGSDEVVAFDQEQERERNYQ